MIFREIGKSLVLNYLDQSPGLWASRKLEILEDLAGQP